MVDAIGGRTTSGVTSVTRVQTVGATRSVKATPERPSEALGQVARALSAAPPVDTERVERIRRAIAEGRFPLSPTTVADRLIALRLDWTSHEQA